MRRPRLVAVFVAIALFLGACASGEVLVPQERGIGNSALIPAEADQCPPGPVRPPDPDKLDILAEAVALAPITQAVTHIRCLPAVLIGPKFTTRAELSVILDETEDPDDVAELERVEPIAVLLGWIERGTNLHDEFRKLADALVLGFYDPRTKALYVVTADGEVTSLVQETLAHEWVHALQDGKYGLEKLDDAVPDDDFDRSGALSAVLEGDATHYQEAFTAENFSPDKLRAAREEEFGMAATSGADIKPGPLLSDLMMPYMQGPGFIADVVGGEGFPPLEKLYGRLPITSTEILHPDLYKEGFRPEPTDSPDLGVKLGADWAGVVDGTWGEYSTANTISGFSGTAVEQELSVVDGWHGDNLRLWRSGEQGVLALTTKWDTQSTQRGFLDRMHAALLRSGTEGQDGFVHFPDDRACSVSGAARVSTLICTDSATAVAALGGPEAEAA